MSRGSCWVETALSRKCPKCDTSVGGSGLLWVKEIAAAGCKASGLVFFRGS